MEVPRTANDRYYLTHVSDEGKLLSFFFFFLKHIVEVIKQQPVNVYEGKQSRKTLCVPTCDLLLC